MARNVKQQGVISTKFLMGFGASADISHKVRELFRDSEKIRASIAFWTLSFQDLLSFTLDFHALQAFKSADSFLCCDIQLPTNIDALTGLKQYGVDVFLNFRRLVPTLRKQTSSLGLLHTKLILADKKDGTAEIWIGSHNWTQFALKGINTEASVILEVEQSSPLYEEAYQFLKDIQAFCDPFDLSKVDLYKQLQTKDVVDLEREVVIIDLEGRSADSLSGTSIWLFGTEDDDYQSLKKVGSDIKLVMNDSVTGRKFLYDAKIIQTGQMEAYNSYATGLGFIGQKRYAFSRYKRFPELQPLGPVPTVVQDDARFFVAVQILAARGDKFEIGSRSENKRHLWQDAVADPVLSLDAVKSWYREANGHKRYEVEDLIQVPYFKECASKGVVDRDEFLLLPLEDKRQSAEYQFISKGVVRGL